MRTAHHTALLLGVAVIALTATSGVRVYSQAGDANSAPNPYKMEDSADKLPEGRKLGSPIGVEVGSDGKSLWIFERCGGNDCGKSKLSPIMHFDPAGKMIANFGADMFNFPHGLGVDGEGNVYVTDGRGKNGKGDVMVKFSPEGKVLMTLGKPGMPGDSR